MNIHLHLKIIVAKNNNKGAGIAPTPYRY
jgi:hypothetical protein